MSFWHALPASLRPKVEETRDAVAYEADRGVEPGLHVPPAEVLRHAGRSPPPAPPKK